MENNIRENIEIYTNSIGKILKDTNRYDPLKVISKASIHQLAKNGDIENIESAFNEGISIHFPDELGKYPIHSASYYGQLETIKFLVANGASIDAKIEPLGHTPLYIAVQRGYKELAKWLIRNGANTKVADNLLGRGLLHLAAKNSDVKMAKLLIACGLDPHISDKLGFTANDLYTKLRV